MGVNIESSISKLILKMCIVKIMVSCMASGSSKLCITKHYEVSSSENSETVRLLTVIKIMETKVLAAYYEP